MDLPLTAAVASHLEVLTDAPSTNDVLSERARDSPMMPHLSVLLTDTQTAGRGRLGRSWTAAPGASLAVSVLLRRLPSGDARGWIPLAAGVAMADAIAEQLPDHDVAVKWPNDVLVDGRKICGILAQATQDAVVVGTGVNTAMTESQLPVQTATSFAVIGVGADADRLLATYLRGLDELIADLAAAGDAVSSGLHAAASGRCATIGLDVRVSLPGDSVLVGTATGLDADGRLLVLAGGAERPISAGDVVHVRPA
ncbi:biotin--[acetyl-CoA-carboxylase] ligase [Microbacterium sp. APC 3901]|uniref:biotin--[acetyl-CoA-carboxylase] ligase n=1 Tax=Microbacterium sp. APC 3901 TaxID=3035192 RepID=UPI0025B62864|nr:biotin--[acetyl-CoA-carboxylase] ligase [Microbacterium sp. APC 3901]MDN3443559.1 biotin--[acetyl-CoA-carboxylase] ligase [Microbacterium sp. APC 3901]